MTFFGGQLGLVGWLVGWLVVGVKNQHIHTPPTCGSTSGPLSCVQHTAKQVREFNTWFNIEFFMVAEH